MPPKASQTTKEKVIDYIRKKGFAYTVGIGLFMIVALLFYIAYQTQAIGDHYNNKSERETLNDLLEDVQ